MIQVDNIQISYGKKEVISSGSITLHCGDFCLIRGESGTGKTSLLNLLAFNSDSDQLYDYFVDDENMLQFDDEKKSEFLLNRVACVLQNNLIFSEFTVMENLETFCEIGYGSIKKKRIQRLVRKLHLKKLLNKKAKKLSGGEKQRVAIACAILKNADLYLFDEPTSMIDIERKADVLELLKALADQGKIVVVVSHELDKAIFNKVYILQNHRIILEKDRDVGVSNHHLQNRKRLQLNKICGRFSRKFFLCQPYINALYILVTSFCVAMIVNIIGGALASIQMQQMMADVVKSPELLVVNTESQIFTASDEHGAYPINDEDYQSIQNIEHVLSADRYVYFPLEDGIADQLPVENDVPHFPTSDECVITLKENGKTVNSFNYLNEMGNRYAIYPTYEHQKIEESCSSVKEGEGIYITKRVAELLNIKEVGDQTINLSFSVPIGNTPGYFTNGATGEVSLRRFMYNVLSNKDFPLKGIIAGDNYYYSYMLDYNADFFLDIDIVEAIQKGYHEKYQDLLLKLSETPMPWASFKQYYKTRIIDSGIWKSSALIVQVDKNENINEVISEVTKLNSSLSVAVKSYGMNNIDKGMTTNVMLTALGYSAIIFIVVLISIAILKGYRRKTRQTDYELLKKNGFHQKHIWQIEYKENLIEIFTIFRLSVVMAIGLYIYFTKMLNAAIRIGIWMIAVLACLVIVDIFIGNAVSKIFK